MKNYTIHFLILTIITAVLGFGGFDFYGSKAVRIICLFAGIALMVSCMDAIILSRKNRKLRKQSIKNS